MADPKSTIAVVVGIEQYGDAISNLDGPASDALRFIDWLHEKRKVPLENIYAFISPLENKDNPFVFPNELAAKDAATLDNITKCFIENLPDLQKPGRELIVYWAGHGTYHANRKHCYFCANASKKRPMNLDLNELVPFLTSVKFKPPNWKNVFLIFDGCSGFSEKDGVSENMTMFTFPEADGVKNRGVFVLQSCSRGDYAVNDNKKRSAVFSNELFERLNQAKNPTAPLQEILCPLAKEIRDHFIKLVSQQKAFQTPDYKCENGMCGGSSLEVESILSVSFLPSVHGAISDVLIKHKLLANPFVLEKVETKLPNGMKSKPSTEGDERIKAIVSTACEMERGLMIFVTALSRSGVDLTELLPVLQDKVHLTPEWKDYLRLKKETALLDPLEAECRTAWDALELNGMPNVLKFETPFSSMIDTLATKQVETTDAPLFAFLHLCREFFGEATARIDQWVDEVAKLHKLDLSAIHAKAHTRYDLAKERVRVRALHTSIPVILIQITFVPFENAYMFDVYLYRDRNGPIKVVLPSDSSEKLFTLRDSLQKKASEAISRALVLANDCNFTPGEVDRLRVEVIAPIMLLSQEPLDLWEMEYGIGGRDRISNRYPFSLRIQERLLPLPAFVQPLMNWKSKWQKLPESFKDEKLRYWKDGDKADAKSALPRTTVSFLAKYSKNEHAIALSDLAAIANEGVPLALWVRGHTGSLTQAQIKFNELLWTDDSAYMEWPEKLLKIRQELPADGTCPVRGCTSISLLWDSPNLIPPINETIGGAPPFGGAPTVASTK